MNGDAEIFTLGGGSLSPHTHKRIASTASPFPIAIVIVNQRRFLILKLDFKIGKGHKKKGLGLIPSPLRQGKAKFFYLLTNSINSWNSFSSLEVFLLITIEGKVIASFPLINAFSRYLRSVIYFTIS